MEQVAAVVEIANLLKARSDRANRRFRHLFDDRPSNRWRKYWVACAHAQGSSRCWGITTSGWAPRRSSRALRRQRIQVLRNRHRLLHRGGASLYLAGVDDYGYGADMERALRGIPERAATILLAHNPRLLTAAACRGVGLVLSGHTHGGQVNVPLLGTVYGRSPEQMRFKKGWDRLGGTQIYVSRGIGTIVLPVRWRCPAEVPLLELEPHQREWPGFRRIRASTSSGKFPFSHGNQMGNRFSRALPCCEQRTIRLVRGYSRFCVR